MTSHRNSQTASPIREEVDWLEVQSVLREQLKPYGYFGARFLKSHEHHQRYLVNMVKRTAVMGESNSVLVIGPRGRGKTALLECAKAEAFKIESVQDNMICVELNGLVHIDDHTALKSIIQQLQLQSMGAKIAGSFAERFASLLAAMNKGNQNNKSVLFVLDEFDLFCHHKKQALLLNLFDVAQSQQLPICVIGLTCRIDVIQLLEKRVKSRFTHRQLHLFDNLDFSSYKELAVEALCLSEEFSDEKFREEWNTHVKSIIQETAVVAVLKEHYECNKNIRELKQLLLFPVSLLNASHPKLEPGDFVDALKFNTIDSKSVMLQGLSILEMSLVIAMMHLAEIYDGEPFNFEMVYHEYRKFSQRKSMLQNLNKAVVLKAFEHLQAAELIRPTSGTTTNVQKQYKLVRLLVEPTDIKEALQQYPNLPTQLQQWASSVIADV